MTVLYPNLCYNKLCYEGKALSLGQIKNMCGSGYIQKKIRVGR